MSETPETTPSEGQTEMQSPEVESVGNPADNAAAKGPAVGAGPGTESLIEKLEQANAVTASPESAREALKKIVNDRVKEPAHEVMIEGGGQLLIVEYAHVVVFAKLLQPKTQYKIRLHAGDIIRFWVRASFSNEDWSENVDDICHAADLAQSLVDIPA